MAEKLSSESEQENLIDGQDAIAKETDKGEIKEKPNYKEILGGNPDATPDEIGEAFDQINRDWIGGEKGLNQEDYEAAENAARTLLNDHKKAEYDKSIFIEPEEKLDKKSPKKKAPPPPLPLKEDNKKTEEYKVGE